MDSVAKGHCMNDDQARARLLRVDDDLLMRSMAARTRRFQA